MIKKEEKIKNTVDKIEELQNQLSKLMEKLSLLEEEHLKKDQKLAEYLDGWKRSQADLINYKREEKERLEQFKYYVNLELIKKLVMPILDDLDRTIDNIPADLSEHSWIKGLIAVRNNVLENLKSMGVITFGTVGENFDPAYYEVISTDDKPEMDNKVVKVVSRGLKTETGLVIRPAKVILGKSKN